MNFLNLLGNWLESSGWTESLVKAKITSPRKVESFLSDGHPKRSRYAHQVTCASLSLLMNKAYQQSHSKNDQNSWMSAKKRSLLQFLCWCMVMELEPLLLSLIKSLRTFNFPTFISCLEKIAPWMFAMDHTNYARWLPIFIHDLKSLQSNHPGVYKEFCQGKFSINRSGKPFSSMGIDQVHEQNSKLVKIDGGASGLLNDNAALLKWTVAGSEITEMVQSFRCNDDETTEIPHHHKNTDAFEKQFCEDVSPYVMLWESSVIHLLRQKVNCFTL